MLEWFKVVDPDKVRFKRRKKIKVAKVGEEGPELWPAELEAGPTLPVPRVTNYDEILGGKMRAAGEKE